MGGVPQPNGEHSQGHGRSNGAAAGAPPGRPAVQVVEERSGDRYLRRKILYQAGREDWVSAYLLIPLGKMVYSAVCLHQTTRIGMAEPAGLDGFPNLHYAHELAGRAVTGRLCRTAMRVPR